MIVLLDDAIEPTVAMGEMIRVRQERGGLVLLAVEVEPSQVSNYGVFDVEVTDVIALFISEGHPGHVVVHDGIRHDLGNPAGFIPASVEFGLRHSEYGPAFFHDLEANTENYRLERN